METEIKNRFWNLLQAPSGFPELDKDIKFDNENLKTELPENGVLIKVKVMSLDPYMRGTMRPVSYGRTLTYPRKMFGGAVGQIIKTKNPEFSVGDLVLGNFGWQEYSISDGSLLSKITPDFPLSYYLGVLGMPGATAYLGLLDICDPKPGEIVAVSAATGAVGQLVGQIAKIKGAKVLGFAGSEEKCAWAKEIGYDWCLSYRNKSTEELTKELGEVLPSKINCYFDNTGGPCTEAVFNHLAVKGRVSVCGQIAYYNLKELPKTVPMTSYCLNLQLKVEGWIVSSRWDAKKDWPLAHKQLGEWIKDGKLKVKEQVVEGLENAFSAFLTLFQDSGKEGTNFGKLVVKVSE